VKLATKIKLNKFVLETKIKLNKFVPRPYQLPILDAIENKGYKRVLAILPRRAGKDITAFNLCIRQCLRRPCVVYYIFPTYSQAKKVIWDSITNTGDRILEYIPEELIISKNSQEMKIRFINGSLLQLVGSDNYDCFDDQTEILTENGWRLFKDLNGEKVATLDKGSYGRRFSDNYSPTNRLTYETPSKYMAYDYDGELYTIKNSSLDFMVTPNHRFYVKSVKGVGKFKKISDPTIRYDMIPSTCEWEGENPPEILGYKSEDFVAFLGIFLSEGSTYRSHTCNRVTICQTKQSVRNEIRELLNRMGLTYVETPDRFNIENIKLYDYCAQFGLQNKRFIPKDIKALDKDLLHLLFEWLVLGDGYRCKTYTAYYSVSKQLIDDVQEVIIKLGKSGNVSVKKQRDSVIDGRLITAKQTLYEIRVRHSKFKRLHGANGKPYIHTVPYKGKVYCINVSSGVIKVRRNGKEYWSGNSLMGTNPQLCVFSEYALQDPRAYQYIRPILTANDGVALFISCVAPNTLVIGENGIRRISSLSSSRQEYTDYNKKIWGLGGFHNAEQFYYGGRQKTSIITLENGFQIECTAIHPLWNGKEWIKARDLRIGDILPLQYGQDVWGRGLDVSLFDESNHAGRLFRFDYSKLDEDFFYLLGLIHADGSYGKSAVTVTKKKDKEIIDFLREKGFKTRLDGLHHDLYSKTFVDFLEFLEFQHGARNKTFPDKLFECTKLQLTAFLQGLFDCDGTSHSNPKKWGAIKLTSTCKSFMQDLQVLLANFGIISSLRSEEKSPTKRVKAWSTVYNLEITGYFAHVFYRDIGFRLERKQRNWDHVPASCASESGNVYPIDIEKLDGYCLPKNIVTNPKRISRRLIDKLNKRRLHPYLQSLLEEKLFYVPIKEIIDNENEVFDFVIPVSNSFMSNSFLSHNTPRGKNHLWELYQIAQNSPDWYCYKLTVEDTGHISLKDIERERHEGIMSDDLIQQEYYTSFDMGVEGSYYSKYLDRMRLKGQVGQVPWESAFKVHTSWDLGVRDATSIIFFQIIGQTVRIIDCYENSKHGLEHYIKILDSKPYSYGKHIAPHDIAVREFGSGVTRIEKAKQLGVTFIVADNITIPDGIESVRSVLSKTWIDQNNCAPLLRSLENYRQEYDTKKKVYKNHPLHDWSSNFADSMRYLCISLPKTRDGLSAEELDKRYKNAVLGPNAALPAVFRDDVPKY